MFRKAVFADCGRIYELICDMENKELPYAEFSEIFRKQTESENYYCLVCEADGKVVAELNLRFEQQLHHAGRIAEIMEFSVDEAYRSKGLGKKMLAEAEIIAAENGCMQIEVACNQLRQDTHRFYLREGMHNFHFKFSKALDGSDTAENILGK